MVNTDLIMPYKIWLIENKNFVYSIDIYEMSKEWGQEKIKINFI